MVHPSLDETVSTMLARFSEVKLAFIYGSAAQGRLTGTSDIDIAIAAVDVESPDRLSEISLSLSDALRREVDLIDLHTCHGPILAEVLQKGKRLFCQSTDLQAQLMLRLWYHEADMMPNIRLIRKQHLKRAFA